MAAAGVPSPQVDATALAEVALGVPQLVLALPPHVPAGFEAAYDRLVERRAAREPLQHITGYATFRHLTVRVERGVFLPRPETEVVAQSAIDEARRLRAAGAGPLVVDLCSGSGVIALSVADEVPGSRVVGLEIDPSAVELARANASELRVRREARNAPVQPPGHVQFAPGDDGDGDLRFEIGDVTDPALLEDLNGTVDIVISNPPYIPDDAVPLEPEVANHDPRSALFGGGTDGLDLPRHVVAAAARLLRPGGLLVMEHADVQGPAARDVVDRTGAFEPATTHQDLTGRDRFVQARRRTV